MSGISETETLQSEQRKRTALKNQYEELRGKYSEVVENLAALGM
jgi:hypothetical protein